MTTSISIRVVAFAFTGYPVGAVAELRGADVTFLAEPLDFPSCNLAVIRIRTAIVWRSIKRKTRHKRRQQF